MVRKAERMKINAPGASYSALSRAVDRSGPFHLIVWILVQIATSREAAKGAKEYTVQRPNFASSHVLPRELIGCHI